MKRLLLAAAAMALFAGCIVSLNIPHTSAIGCSATEHCPAGMRCIENAGLCSNADTTDSTAPTLLGIALTPEDGGRDFLLRFSTSELLLIDPSVIGTLGGVTHHWDLIDDSDGYTFGFVADAGTSDGIMTVTVRVMDRAGNSDIVTAGTVIVDTTGPRIDSLLLTVLSQPPGTEDSVAGVEGATEASALIELYSDSGLTTMIDTTFAADDGSFGALWLGDNFTDEHTTGVSGQMVYWLRATDNLGNVGDSVPVVTSLDPPEISIVAIERLASVDPSTWVSANTFKQTSGIANGRVRLLIVGALSALPRLVVSDAGTPVFDIPCSLTALESIGGSYTCAFAPSGTEPEASELTVTAIAVSAGAGNIGAVIGAPIRLDFTSPEAPLASGLTVDMRPTGVDDQLIVNTGAVEPFAEIEVFTVESFITPSGPGCANNIVAIGNADSVGAATVSLGDNTVTTAYVSQNDQVGNAGCGSCMIGQPCAAAVLITNDSVPPAVSVSSSVANFTGSTSAQFSFWFGEQGPIDSAGAIVISPPVQLLCSLDAAPETACNHFLDAQGLNNGAHELSYRVIDALNNSSPPASFQWQVLATTPVFSGEAHAVLGNKAYVVDAAGLGHLFITGDALYHYYETSTGVFASEIVSDRATAYAVARMDKTQNTIYVLYQHQSLDSASAASDVLLMSGTTGSWSTTALLYGRVEPEGIDLAVAPDSSVYASFTRCSAASPRMCFLNGGSLNAFTVDITHWSSTTSSTENIAAATHAFYPTVAIDSGGGLWLSYRESARFGSNQIVLMHKTSDIWQAPLTVGGNAAPAGAPAIDSEPYRFSPTLVVDSADRPVLSYKPTVNGKVWVVSYDGNTLDFVNTTNSSQQAALDQGNTNLWYVYANSPGVVRRRDPSSQWTTSNLGLTAWPDRVTGALISDGVFGVDASLQAVFSTRVQGRTRLDRVAQDGVARQSTTVVPLDRYRSFAQVEGATTPTLVTATAASMQLVSYSNGQWTQGATIRSSLLGEGYGVAAVRATTGFWIAHQDFSDSSRSRVLVEQGSGGSWSSHGPISAAGIEIRFVRISLLPNGSPVVAFLRRSQPAEIQATWWDGTQFTPVTTLKSVSTNQVQDLSMLGDHNQGASGGETWLAYSDVTNLEIGLIRFDVAVENTAILGCESCQQQSVIGAQQSNITLGHGPSGAPELLQSDPTGPLNLLTYTGTGWSSRDLRAELVTQVFNSSSNTWETGTGCFPVGASTRSRFAFDYNSALQLRIHGLVACSLWSSNPVEALGIESFGGIKIYPIGEPGSSLLDPSHVVWTLPNGNALAVWGDLAMGDILSLESSAL